jgi:two-component system, response regulator, stage 0 sporulation protein A
MGDATILVVEDDDAIRNLLVEYLHEHGTLQVDSVRDGVEALHRLSSRHYDVVVLDLIMPHMSGIDVLDSLQILSLDPSLNPLADPPAVLVITSEAPETLNDSEIARRCPSFVRGVLRKPFDIAVLAERVETLCSR